MSLSAGLTALERGDYSLAFTILQPLAEAGDSEAECLIGNMYQLGLGVESDILKAGEWYRKAAEKGHAVAANNLAGILLAGANGEQPDLQEAAKWYDCARERGFLHAPYSVEKLSRRE